MPPSAAWPGCSRREPRARHYFLVFLNASRSRARHVVHVRRDDVPAHRRHELLRFGAKRRCHLRVEGRHGKPAALHRRDRVGVQLRRLAEHPLLECLGGRDDHRPIVRLDLGPGLVGQQERAVQRRHTDIEHVLGVAEHLEQKRRIRWAGRGIDHARGELELGRNVACREGDGTEAVRLVPLHHAVVTLTGEELGCLHVGERLERFLREQLDPTGAAPVEQLEAFGVQPLLERRRELLEDVLPFGVRFEEERDAEDVEGIVDDREARQHEQIGLQLIDARPHHPNRCFLTALRASRIDGELDAPRCLGFQLRIHVEQRFVPRGVGRGLRSQLDGDGGAKQRGYEQRDRHRE